MFHTCLCFISDATEHYTHTRGDRTEISIVLCEAIQRILDEFYCLLETLHLSWRTEFVWDLGNDTLDCWQ